MSGAALLSLVPVFKDSIGKVISSGADVVTGYGRGVENIMTSYGRGAENIMGAVADRIRGGGPKPGPQ